MKTKLVISTFALASITFTSCNNSNERAHDDQESLVVETKDTTPVTVDETTKFKFDFALANIPSPANSMQEISSWKTNYDNTLLHDVKKAASYTNEFDRAINLGIYNIDLCYAMAHEKGADVLTYMKSVMQLSDAMSLTGAVNSMVGKRAEGNLNNKDSLFKILDEIFVKSDDYLRTNDRVFTAATIFTGGWIESLYLTCQTGIKNTDDAVKKKVNTLLWEQRFHLGNIITMLEDHKSKKEAAQLIGNLKPIHEEILAIKQATDMTGEKFNSVSDKISSLRKKLSQ
jgi:hypothetical protein